jgi:hypothetical protein
MPGRGKDSASAATASRSARDSCRQGCTVSTVSARCAHQPRAAHASQACSQAVMSGLPVCWWARSSSPGSWPGREVWRAQYRAQACWAGWLGTSAPRTACRSVSSIAASRSLSCRYICARAESQAVTWCNCRGRLTVGFSRYLPGPGLAQPSGSQVDKMVLSECP